MLSIKCVPYESDKTKENRGSSSDTTYESKIMSSSDPTNNDSYNYDISYSATITNRADVVTPFSYIHDEKDEFFEQRLEILKQQMLVSNNNNNNNTYIDMNKLLVYISLEYILNCNPDPILLKDIYDTLDKHNIGIINGYYLCNYFKINKNELIEFVELNDIDRDIQISHCCQWKLTQIFLMYKSMKTMKIKYNEKKNELNEMKEEIIKLRRIKTIKTRISKISTISTWKQYTDRLMYIKQRYPTEYIDRNKAWKKWSKLLNKIEESGKIDCSSINNIWQYIDFARMSLGKYSNWLWCPVNIKNYKYNQVNQHNIEWTKKYLVLMDFNLFLFDQKIEPRSIKQILLYKHSILSIASIQNIISSTTNSYDFQLKLNKKNYSIQFRSDDIETRQHWIDELIYQIKCIQDLLKIPNIKLKSVDPDKNIWLPIPIGYHHRYHPP